MNSYNLKFRTSNLYNETVRTICFFCQPLQLLVSFYNMLHKSFAEHSLMKLLQQYHTHDVHKMKPGSTELQINIMSKINKILYILILMFVTCSVETSVDIFILINVSKYII